MRVIAGQYRSRVLRSLTGMEIRPTSDRLRETLFNVLTAGNGAVLEGTTWLDLYAGTGAVGIEALSRGAGKVYFVEKAKAAVEVIRKNLQSLQVTTGFEVLHGDVGKVLTRLEGLGVLASFVFLDPPYAMQYEYARSLQMLGESRLLDADALVIVEHEKRFDPGERFGRLVRTRQLAQGDAALSFYRLDG